MNTLLEFTPFQSCWTYLFYNKCEGLKICEDQTNLCQIFVEIHFLLSKYDLNPHYVNNHYIVFNGFTEVEYIFSFGSRSRII